ncbi:MAG: hypothetical protein R3213_01955 [Flavobacteriaceae bacterium]|nr:hypothetical protein [Flavobacteriaceae bacterium]
MLENLEFKNFHTETVEEFLARGGKIQYISMASEPTPSLIARAADSNYKIVDWQEEKKFNYYPPMRWRKAR